MERMLLPPWDPEGRESFVAARMALGHTQEECAERLKNLGASGANQSSVSKWESGEVELPRVPTRRAIASYVAEAPPPTEAAARSPEADRDFESTVRGLTSEPLLGPRQAEFVDQMTNRLGQGPPMTEWDQEARRDMQRILGLE